ncbi:4-hydroxythreonine-4-phosphate dehydrogenase PdxA [Candidatus Pelagibacter sp.]|jgi:4-hydroxythreonine-4-phosphate dehydrogenase|nr:4-hydroxythreonine-4-phosphate dehydrogenase PdxA [Candidatus Pelagibacter sp.]MDC0938427.1 4-hydroxythreonine-4-phosphate dehydrogenase PdxA [Candidatus Pelagibacter sp.]MDC1163746.1 4-hydroxythreonine-4-phosphate dehydrogenase PdxA [Candidatus Pelagibacter sp.]
MTQTKANIALLLGDPAGIGPELISNLLKEEITNKANIVVIGEKQILDNGNNVTGKSHQLEIVEDFDQIDFNKSNRFLLDISKGKNHKYKIAEPSKESGESVLEALDLALNLAKEKKIDAINFAPMNKTSLKLGGNTHSDELQLMAEKLEVKSFCCEFNVIDNFWTARVTSHIPIKEVAQHITKENILKPIKLINEVMELNGVKNPRIAVQALNPHAEFGTEEKDEIIPAIEEAKKLGFNTDGPLPCDTSFVVAYKNKNHDCMVGMYHDALQSGLKAFGFDRGVTVQGGLTIPVTTTAHGSAFAIAGKNEANLAPILNSFKIALSMAENKKKLI